MRRVVIILLFLFSMLMFKSSSAWFASFCQFDKITWSPDGQKIAFERHYVSTGGVNIYCDTLIADLSTRKITCVTPEVHKFILSTDRKRMLFSSTYGLYLMELEPMNEPEQILFMTDDPTMNSGMQLKDFAFSKADGRILYLFDDIYSGIKQIWGLELATEGS